MCYPVIMCVCFLTGCFSLCVLFVCVFLTVCFSLFVLSCVCVFNCVCMCLFSYSLLRFKPARCCSVLNRPITGGLCVERLLFLVVPVVTTSNTPSHSRGVRFGRKQNDPIRDRRQDPNAAFSPEHTLCVQLAPHSAAAPR